MNSLDDKFREVVDNSEILKKASYSEIIKLDKWLHKAINDYLLLDFTQPVINNFWVRFDNIDLSDHTSIESDPNDLYSVILYRVKSLIRQNDENNWLYMDWEDELEVSEDIIDLLSVYHIWYIHKIRLYIDQILLYNVSQNIYDIKEKTKDNLWSAFDIKYKKDFIEEVLNKNSKHNNIANIIYFFEFYWNFNKWWYYNSDLLELSDSQLTTINHIYSVHTEWYEDTSEEWIAWYNRYINNFMVKLFSEQTPDIFDSYKTILDDHNKLDNVDFILKNASHHISKNVSDWNYKMLKLDQRLSYRMTKMDQIINANNIIFGIITKVCWSNYKVTRGAVLKNIENLDENGDNFYTVAVWVNEKLEILVYVVKLSGNQTKYEQVWILWSYTIEDQQNLFDVITTLWYDQDIYEAVWMPKEKINFNL